MSTARAPRKRLVATVTAALTLTVIVTGTIVYLARDNDGENPAGRGLTSDAQVDPATATTVVSDDGALRVEIPAGAVAGAGTVSVDAATGRGGRAGWAIELDGTELVNDATLRFKTPELAKGEPLPTVRYAATPGGRYRFAAPTSSDTEEIVVATDHFSFWTLDVWGQLLASTTTWVSDKLDKLASLPSTGNEPRCEGEQAVRAAGYKVTSDPGRRVYWCLGTARNQPVLKVVNGRGYGVAVEYAPGLTVTTTDRGGTLDILADAMRPPPSRRVNKVELLPPGNKIEFALAASRTTGAEVTLNAGAYLLTAASFAVDTVTMVMRKAGVRTSNPKKPEQQLLIALQAQKCMNSLTSMARTDLSTPANATSFFNDALAAAFDCVAAAIDDIDLGVVNDALVGPLVWLVSGLSAVVNGAVGVADGLSDIDGYQITITAAPVEDPTQKIVIDPFTKKGLAPGWKLDGGLSDSSYIIDCSPDRGSPHAVGAGTHACGGTASAANACWTSKFDVNEVWCLNALDINDRTLRAYPAADPVNENTAAPAVPEPLFLELSDGSTWWFRIGGAWGGRADDLVGAYGCMNKKGVCGAPRPAGTDGSVILVPQRGGVATVDRSEPVWKVRVGLLGDPNTDYPNPKWMGVTKAWFITGHLWDRN